jgi:hypothetical protein
MIKHFHSKHAAAFLMGMVFCGFSLVSPSALAKQFIGYTGKKWSDDHRVLQGDCDTKVIANQLKKEQAINTMAVVDNIDQSGLVESNPSTPNVSKLASPQALAALSNQTLSRQVNAYCFGHTLELVPSGQAVRWINPISGHGVYISAGPKTDTCRSFLGIHMVGTQKNKFRGEACSQTPGVWRVQPFVPQP